MVPLSEVAELVRRAVEVDVDALYPELGVRSFGRGTFHKPPLTGADAGSKRLFRIESGDLVFNIVFAWEGAVAVAGPEDNGRFGSHRFLTFVPDPKRAEAGFIKAWFNTPAGLEVLGRASPGGAGRNRTLGVEAAKQMPVPLPPLDVQRRIVERLDSVEAGLSTISALRKERDADSEQLLRTLMSSDPSSTPVPMSDLVRLREPDVTVDRAASYSFAGVYSFGRGVFRAGVKTGMDFAYLRLSTLHAGDFTYPKLMAWEGALGVVPTECDGCVVSTEFPVFEVLRDRVLPEVLDVHFRNPSIWPKLAGASTGTNARRRRLNPVDFLAYQFPLPSRKAQAQVAAAYRLSQEIKHRDHLIDAETLVIVPALLAEAFGSG
jgi:type I restriction enzyme S subunit